MAGSIEEERKAQNDGEEEEEKEEEGCQGKKQTTDHKLQSSPKFASCQNDSECGSMITLCLGHTSDTTPAQQKIAER